MTTNDGSHNSVVRYFIQKVVCLNNLMDAYDISDFEAFADAAEEFHPHIKFFATFNSKVSKRVINKIGSISRIFKQKGLELRESTIYI